MKFWSPWRDSKTLLCNRLWQKKDNHLHFLSPKKVLGTVGSLLSNGGWPQWNELGVYVWVWVSIKREGRKGTNSWLLSAPTQQNELVPLLIKQRFAGKKLRDQGKVKEAGDGTRIGYDAAFGGGRFACHPGGGLRLDRWQQQSYFGSLCGILEQEQSQVRWRGAKKTFCLFCIM